MIKFQFSFFSITNNFDIIFTYKNKNKQKTYQPLFSLTSFLLLMLSFCSHSSILAVLYVLK